MAKQDLQAQLGSKRAELATVKRDMAAATQESIKAGNELKVTLDEQKATVLVARQTVQTNKSRVLGEQAAAIEAEISAIERTIREEQHAAIRAAADAAREAACEAGWAFWQALAEAERADRARLDAESRLSGFPHGGSLLTREERELRGVLVRMDVAEEVSAPSPGARSELRRKGTAHPPTKQNGAGIKAMAAQLAAAVTG